MSNKPVRLFIATPCYGGNLHYQYVVSLFGLTKSLDQMKIGYTVSFLGNESLVTRARNIMVGKFLGQASCTHLLFIDADIQFTPDGVMRLLAAQKDVCFGVYPAKTFRFERLEKFYNQVDNPLKLQSLCLDYMLSYEVDENQNAIIDPVKKLAKVKYGTTGFMLIKREVIEKMIRSYPHLRYTNKKTCLMHNINEAHLYLLFDCIKEPETNDYLSEDYAFSYLWRRLGGEIWADMQSKLTHWGNYQFQGDLDAYLKAL